MPATVPTRGVLKASTNRVRTSTALQGNAMWENVIGITNDQAGTNTGVEALINAPTIGGGRKATQARRQAAAEAVRATGGFDTSITNYQSLLAMAKQQGAVGSGARGACKVCGQTGHLTKQCRNVLPGGAADGEAGGAGPAIAAPIPPSDGEAEDLSFDSSDSSDEERRRKKRRKEKKERRKSKKSKKEKKERSSKKHKRSSKDKKSKKKRRRHSSSGSGSSSSGSDSD